VHSIEERHWIQPVIAILQGRQLDVPSKYDPDVQIHWPAFNINEGLHWVHDAAVQAKHPGLHGRQEVCR
jgi:hypothetical protein